MGGARAARRVFAGVVSVGLLACTAKPPSTAAATPAMDVAWRLTLETDDSARIDAIFALPGGGAAIAGTFSGALDVGTTHLASAGESDLFFATIDAGGNPTWVKRAGGPGADSARDLVASDTTIAVAGAFFPGSTAAAGAVPAGESAGLMALIDRRSKDTTLVFAMASDYAVLDGIARAGDRFVATGYFSGTLVAGGAGAKLTYTSLGASDLVTLAYDRDGEVAWGRSDGGLGADLGLAAAPLGDGAVIDGVASPGARLGQHTFDERRAGGFVAALDDAGKVAWVAQVAGDPPGSFADVATAGDTIYVGGRISGPVDLAGKSLAAAGQSDGVVIAYGNDGELRWAKVASGPGADQVVAVAAGPDGTVTALIEVEGAATVFGKSLTGHGDRDVVVARLSAKGEVQWLRVIGGRGDDYAGDLAVTERGDVLVSGSGAAYGGPFLVRLAP